MKALIWSVAGVVGYLLVGIGWAFWQWKVFVQNELVFYEQERQRFMRFHRVRSSEIPDYLKAEWRHHVDSSTRLRSVPPQQEDYTASLALNMSLWWVSLFFLVGQFLYRHTIERLITEAMNSTNTKINQVKKDLK